MTSKKIYMVFHFMTSTDDAADNLSPILKPTLYHNDHKCDENDAEGKMGN